ncbi:MAG: hypothetical protein IT464_13420 [Planctomycetes bacterium]|nr:hypothetical protein [Planctomycetota bacterium]
MPYITPAKRIPLDPVINQLAALLPDKDFAGTFNYVISRLAAAALAGKTSYARINEIIGALECAKLELYRRIASPYEDAKAGQNGDVY